MNLFKIESPFRRSRKAKDPIEATRAIAERLYRNRQLMKRPGDAEGDWTKAERILKSPVRRILLCLNQSLIRAEKGVVEPVANWVDRADLFRIIERLSPTLEALGVIAIPLVLFFAAQGYQESLRQQELERVQQQAVIDYLNQLSTMLLDLEGGLSAPQNEELRTFITAITLTLLRDPNLDGERKGQVIGFLAQMDLVQGENIGHGPLQLFDDRVPAISLSGADLSHADLSHLFLTGTDLRYAILTHANLRSISLSLASIRDADLSYADLSYASINAASLSRSDLSHTDLSYASFDFTFLSGTNLNHANLSHARLSRAKNLTQSQLDTAYLCETYLPEGITVDPNRDCEKLKEFERAPFVR